MKKWAFFVEGQTELIFLREYILKMFDYQNVWVECYTLFTDNNFKPTEYSFENRGAEYYIQILNVGNDNAVLSRILNREKYLWNNGFHKIFGLRDMFSKIYREAAQNNNISKELNAKFLDGAQKTISQKSERAHDIHFHFAIMETEAWILGLPNCLEKINPNLKPTNINKHLGHDLINTDPEQVYFHPAKVLEEIFKLANLPYNKKAGDINSIMGHTTKDDFLYLHNAEKCDSFSKLHTSLINLGDD